MLKPPLHPTDHLLRIILEHIVACYKAVRHCNLTKKKKKFEGYAHLRLAQIAYEKVRNFGKAVTSFLARGKILNQSSFNPRQEVFTTTCLRETSVVH